MSKNIYQILDDINSLARDIEKDAREMRELSLTFFGEMAQRMADDHDCKLSPDSGCTHPSHPDYD